MVTVILTWQAMWILTCSLLQEDLAISWSFPASMDNHSASTEAYISAIEASKEAIWLA